MNFAVSYFELPLSHIAAKGVGYMYEPGSEYLVTHPVSAREHYPEAHVSRWTSGRLIELEATLLTYP